MVPIARDVFGVSLNQSVSGNSSELFFPWSSQNQNNYGSSRHPNKRPYDLVIILLVVLFSVALNLRVFFIIVTGTGVRRRRRIRPVSILVAHLSSIAICYTFILLLYIVEKWSLVNLSGPGICEVLSFFRNAVYSVFPWNVVSIIYERIRSFRITLEKLLVFRTICLMWILAAIGSWPSVFMVEFEMDLATNVGRCKQIPLLGGFGATLAYELFRFLVYHAMVVSYMIYALFKIRSKLRYLYILKPIPNERMKRKVQRVRYVYLHSIVFILMWLPSGLVLCSQKVLSRRGLVITTFKAHVKVMLFLTFTFFILSPLIYVCLHEDISAFQFCCGRCAVGRSGHGESTQVAVVGIQEAPPCPAATAETQLTPFCTGPETEGRFRETHRFPKKRNKPPRDVTELSDLSRISTVALTTTSDASSFYSSPLLPFAQKIAGVHSAPPRIEVSMYSSSEEDASNHGILGNDPKSESSVFRQVTVHIEMLSEETLL